MAGIRTIVESLRPEDQIGLIGFADDQVTWITEFTTDRERFMKRLSVQEAYGQTALYDAVAQAPKMVDAYVRGRASIVLITDGTDTSSDMNTFDALRLARSVNVPIYSIGFSSLPRKSMARGSKLTVHRVLEMFSEETGGLLLSVHEPSDLAEAVETITRDLRFQYVLGYYPQRQQWDGSYRRVKLELKRGNRTVRTRRGYYADP
jgi:Ca-activated chloride channel family protein